MKRIIALNKTDLRKWLINNQDKECKVSVVVFKKHTGKPSPSHKELMEEAICFGWIDTTINRLDKNRYIRNFSKRNKNSKWSDNTLGYAKNLIKQGKMTSVGLEFYKKGLEKPTHDAGISKNPNMPIGLKRALDKNKRAKYNFDKFPPSSKKMIYRWILRGKREATKIKRINLTLNRAKIGRRDIFGAQENING